MFGSRDDTLTFKQPSPKKVYGKKWAEALEEMHTTNYPLDEHFSKHTLLLQQCGNHVDKHKMTLQKYVGMHPVPQEEYIKLADTLYPKDDKIKTTFVYEVRKNRRYAVAGYTAGHHQHKEHHHAHAPGAMPAEDRMGPSGVPKMGVEGLKSMKQSSGAYAHDDFVDDLPDDYRV